MYFVDLIGRALVTAGLGPVRLLTTEDALAHESTKPLLSSGAFSVTAMTDTVCSPVPLPYRLYSQAARQYQDTMGLARYIRAQGGSERFRLVFVPFFDSASIIPLAIGAYPFGRLPFAGLVIRPSYHQRRVGISSRWRLKEIPERFFYSKILANPLLVGLFSIDPYFVRYHLNKRIAYTPDPASLAGNPEQHALRKRLGISSDAIVILVYGHIDERKGLQQLVNAVTRIGTDLPITIFLCGRQKREIVKFLEGGQGRNLRVHHRLVELNRYISPEEEYEAFLAADIVWVCYGNEYSNSSGAMIRAGQAGRPIITSHYGLTGRMTCDHRVGLSTDADDTVQIAQAIRRLASDRPLRETLGANGLNLFSQHTPEAFVAPIVRHLRRQLLKEDSDNPRPTSAADAEGRCL